MTEYHRPMGVLDNIWRFQVNIIVVSLNSCLLFPLIAFSSYTIESQLRTSMNKGICACSCGCYSRQSGSSLRAHVIRTCKNGAKRIYWINWNEAVTTVGGQSIALPSFLGKFDNNKTSSIRLETGCENQVKGRSLGKGSVPGTRSVGRLL